MLCAIARDHTHIYTHTNTYHSDSPVSIKHCIFLANFMTWTRFRTSPSLTGAALLHHQQRQRVNPDALSSPTVLFPRRYPRFTLLLSFLLTASPPSPYTIPPLHPGSHLLTLPTRPPDPPTSSQGLAARVRRTNAHAKRCSLDVMPLSPRWDRHLTTLLCASQPIPLFSLIAALMTCRFPPDKELWPLHAVCKSAPLLLCTHEHPLDEAYRGLFSTPFSAHTSWNAYGNLAMLGNCSVIIPVARKRGRLFCPNTQTLVIHLQDTLIYAPFQPSYRTPSRCMSYLPGPITTNFLSSITPLRRRARPLWHCPIGVRQVVDNRLLQCYSQHPRLALGFLGDDDIYGLLHAPCHLLHPRDFCSCSPPTESKALA